MADERDPLFASNLARMSDDEVRLQIDPSVQPAPFLRSIAVTELEKRRQKMIGAIMRPTFGLGRVVVWIALLCGIVAAVAAWLWPEIYDL